MKNSVTFQKNQGLSLVELLIAMTLGLILTTGALQMLLASRELNRATESLSKIQENGRFALSFITDNVQMVSYQTEELTALQDQVFMTTDCMGDGNNCTFNGTGTASDRIAAVQNPPNDIDCLGNSVDADDIIANVFFLATTDNVSSLHCRGFNLSTDSWISASQPLVSGIDNMQILYGINNDSASKRTTKWYAKAGEFTDWTSVNSVRISVLASNGDAVGASEKKSRTFKIEGADLSFDDKHERRRFSTTINLNNFLVRTIDK